MLSPFKYWVFVPEISKKSKDNVEQMTKSPYDNELKVNPWAFGMLRGGFDTAPHVMNKRLAKVLYAFMSVSPPMVTKGNLTKRTPLLTLLFFSVLY